MLVLTWIISLTISSPIALGMNYTERRAETPTLCTFYNSDFLIYSSMGSFYIPCVIMICLYSRVFFAIRAHARKATAAAAARKRAAVGVATTAVNDQSHLPPPPANDDQRKQPETKPRGGNTVVAVDMVGVPPGGPNDDVLDPAASVSEDGVERNAEEAETNADLRTQEPAAVWAKRDGLLCPPGIETETAGPAAVGPRGSDVSVRQTSSPARSLASRLKLPAIRRWSTGKKTAEKNASRRERKATKTLAIVLGIHAQLVAFFLQVSK